MPKIINSYNQDDGIAKMLSGLGESFTGNTAATEYARQKALGLTRENQYLPLAADALARGDVNGAIAYGVRGGLKGPDAASYNLLGTSNRVTDIHDPALSRASVGAGHSYAATPMGVDQSEANRVNIANLQTERMMAEERYKTNNTPQMVLDPVTKQPIIARRSDSFGMQPVLGQSEAQGTILQQDTAGLTPDQRAAAGGYAPKLPSELYVYPKPDGSLGTTADGVTDLQTKQPFSGPVQKMAGPNADGLSGDNVVSRGVLNSRINNRTAVAALDSTIADLQKPDSGAAIGYIGKGARLFNDLRAQADAAAKLFNGTDSAAEFASPDVQNAAAMFSKSLFGDPNINSRAQQLGIDSSVLQSRIMDLAYTIAKAQDPGGRISRDDIERASKVVGGTLMDPQAAVTVLTGLKNDLIRSQGIREEETRRMYPKLQAWGASPEPSQIPVPNAPQPSFAPQGAAPQQAAPTAAPAAPEKWGRDANGNLVRMQ